MVSKEFGKKELRKQLTEINEGLQKRNFEIKLIKSEYPFNLHVTNSSVSFATASKNSIIGFSSIDKSLISTYSKLFEEEWNEGIDFQETIKDYKRWLK